MLKSLKTHFTPFKSYFRNGIHMSESYKEILKIEVINDYQKNKKGIGVTPKLNKK